MDFLPAFHALVDCYAKGVVFKISRKTELTFYRSDSTTPPHMIFALQTPKLLLGGCLGFFTIVIKAKSKWPVLDDIPVVKEFSDVFP